MIMRIKATIIKEVLKHSREIEMIQTQEIIGIININATQMLNTDQETTIIDFIIQYLINTQGHITFFYVIYIS